MPSLGVSRETCRNAILYVLYRLRLVLEIASRCRRHRRRRHLWLPTSCRYRYTYACTYIYKVGTVADSTAVPRYRYAITETE